MAETFEHIRGRQRELENVLGRSRDEEKFWRCSKCGAKNAVSRSSCKKCGAKLKGKLLSKPQK